MNYEIDVVLIKKYKEWRLGNVVDANKYWNNTNVNLSSLIYIYIYIYI